MNILVLSWRGPKHPMAGGAEQVMHEHMKGWIEAGHSVTLFSSKIKDYLDGEEVVDGVNIVRKSFQYLGVQIAAFFWYVFGKHADYDLVVDQFHGIPFFTPLYVRKPKLAVLQEVAREVWLKNHFPRPFNWLIGWIGYLGEPLIFLFYKKIPFMVGSDSAKEDLVKVGILRDKITVVPHGVIVEKPDTFPKKEKTKTVAFLGVLMKDKGIEEAIETFAILNEKGKYNFWIIGKGVGSYLEYLKKKTTKLGIEVKFWGFVSQKKKFELLARAHVMINPSVREGWGLVNIEANAMGTPVVAYRSPGLVDSIKDRVSGVLCRENTPESMGNAVYKLLVSENQYKKLSRGAVSWANNFSWARSKRLSLDLIGDIVDQ